MPLKNPDAETEKFLYTIGEVSEIFKVNTSLIRFWEKEFSIIRPKKNKKGNRMFTREDLKNFHIIFSLVKEKGYTLEGARQYLKINRGQADAKDEIEKRLKNIRATLIEIHNQL